MGRRSDTVTAMATVAPPDLSLTEWAVLALVAEHPTHGFAIAKELAPSGDLGQIWTVPRPLVYRALARLEQHKLTQPLEAEPGDGGPARVPVRATRSGRAAVERWLATPAPHVRDLRTRLLLQLRFLDRRGLDLSPLAAAQLEQLQPILAALRLQADTTVGFAGLLARWRYESAEAAARVLEEIVAGRATAALAGRQLGPAEPAS
jgi:DNA-binding PadR family transcriptional regulator